MSNKVLLFFLYRDETCIDLIQLYLLTGNENEITPLINFLVNPGILNLP